MAHFKKLSGATAIATILASSPVFADVTAQDVWGDWRSYIGTLGHDISATEATSGDTLTISNIAVGVQLPENAGTMTITVGEVNLRDNGDGTVTVTLPATTPLKLSAHPDGEEQVEAQIDISQTGYNMVISGDPKDMNYSYTAAKIGLALASMVIDGKSMDGAAKFNLTMDNLIGRSKMQMNDLRYVSQKMSVESVTYDFLAADPNGNGNMTFSGAFSDLSFDGEATIPLDMDPQNPEEIFANGFAFAGAYEFGGGSSEFSFVDKNENVQASSSSKGGELAMSVNAETIEYAVVSEGLSINMSGGDIPFPVSAEIAEAAFSLLMPVGQSEDEQNFGLAFSIAGFTVSDMLWSIFDPQAVLPRDPATVAIDIAGTGKLFANLMNPEAMNSPDIPGELNSMTLNGLMVSVAGAELVGEGAFTFDNSDLATFGGVPRPNGAVDLQLVGANGLIDKLVKMGLVPENQAMQARMMMGLFAVPGEGEDSLKSKLEINEQGHVLANGQRIK